MFRITSVKIFPIKNPIVAGFASIVLDDVFIIYDLKILKTASGLIVCFPDKRARFKCQHCQRKNDFDSVYCKYCGKEFILEDPELTYVDICHPLNHECRQYIDGVVLKAYTEHLEQPEQKPQESLLPT